MRRIAVLLALTLIAACEAPPGEDNSPALRSLTGRELQPRPLPEELEADFLAKLGQSEQQLAAAPEIELSWVWAGRRTAYLGRHREAIELYSRGLERFPNSYRLRRHRGHRYLTLRRFDDARKDLTEAARLAENHPNEMEPDGLPNPSGTPISSTHGNIQYHLGLAHFWLGEIEQAEAAFERASGFAQNDDAICSSHYWLYLMRRRLGMNDAAQAALEPIAPEMTILENHAYHRLLLLYRGDLSPESLGDSEAELYGLSMWHQDRGESRKAQDLWRALADSERWDAFGAISAEVEWARLQPGA